MFVQVIRKSLGTYRDFQSIDIMVIFGAAGVVQYYRQYTDNVPIKITA